MVFLTMSPILLLSHITIIYFHLTSGSKLNRTKTREIVSSDSFKFVVGIKLSTLLFQTHCTGGVIHEKYVLTAAHCFTKEKGENPLGGHYQEYKNYKVRVYARTNSMKRISRNATKIKATDVYFVKQFFENGIDDIAILKLDQTINNVLMFPRPNVNYYNRMAVIAGYGDDPIGDKNNKKFQWSLKTIYAKIVDASLCKLIYPKIGIPVIDEKQLCTKAIESYHKINEKPEYPLGTCRGDSGAPILYQGNIIIGIVSRGVTTCDSRDYPELPIRVSSYLDFIDTVIHEIPYNPKKIEHYSIKNKYF